MQKINVHYLPDKGKKDQEWAEDIMLKALIKQSDLVDITPSYNLNESFEAQPDVIFIHNLAHTALKRNPNLKGASRIERLLKKPIPFFHNSNIKELTEKPRKCLIIGGIRGNQGLRKAWKYIQYFDAIHTSNEYLKYECERAGAKTAFVLPPGIDYERFKPRPTYRPETFTVGWAGDSTKPMKNFNLLPYFGYPYYLATKEHYYPPDQMHLFYPQVSAYVYMSSHEGCNRTILEACSCGLPVVTSDAGTVREFIGDEWIIKGDPRKTQFLVEAKKRLKTLETDYGLCLKVGMENRKNVERFSWPNIAYRFELIIKNLVSHSWELFI